MLERLPGMFICAATCYEFMGNKCVSGDSWDNLHILHDYEQVELDSIALGWCI